MASSKDHSEVRDAVGAGEPYLAVAGILFVIALIVNIVAGWTPDPGDSPAKMVKGYIDNHNAALLGGYLNLIISAAFAVFVAALWVAELRESSRALALIAIVGATAGNAIHAVEGAVQSTVAAKVAQHADASTTYALSQTTFILSNFGELFLSLFLLASGLIIVSTARVLPRWLGWLAIVAGVLDFVGTFSIEDPRGSIVALFGFIGLILLMLFVLISSVFLLIRQGKGKGLAT